MARDPPNLALLLLLLLASDLWAQEYPLEPEHDVEVDEVWAVQGQSVAVKCHVTFHEGEYEAKTWCREKVMESCVPLVTSSQPQTMARSAQYFLWDNPVAGFFFVIVNDVKKRDTGFYWCGTYTKDKIKISRRIKLVVSSEATSGVSDSEQGWLGNNFLVLLLCVVFLVVKVLALVFLLTFLTCRALGFTNTVGIMAATAPNLASDFRPKDAAG